MLAVKEAFGGYEGVSWGCEGGGKEGRGNGNASQLLRVLMSLHARACIEGLAHQTS